MLISYQKSTSYGLPLLRLRDHHCRWPLGDPKSPDLRYCAREVVPGKSWCKHHLAVVFINRSKPAPQPVPYREAAE